MKKIISVLILLSFITLVSSCQKEKAIRKTDIQSKDQFKDVPDNPILGHVPTIHGQLFLSSSQVEQGVDITFEGIGVTYFSSTVPDANGNFTFYNVVTGDYKRKVYVGNELYQTIDYVVE